MWLDVAVTFVLHAGLLPGLGRSFKHLGRARLLFRWLAAWALGGVQE